MRGTGYEHGSKDRKLSDRTARDGDPEDRVRETKRHVGMGLKGEGNLPSVPGGRSLFADLRSVLIGIRTEGMRVDRRPVGLRIDDVVGRRSFRRIETRVVAH